MVRTSDSRLRELCIESSYWCFKAWTISCTPHCSSSVSCINEYQPIDSGGYVKNLLHAIIAEWLNASEEMLS